MDDAANPDSGGRSGGGGGRGGCGGGRGGRGGCGIGWSGALAGDASTGPAGVVEELDELWPSRRPSAAMRLADAWVASPQMSQQWTYGLGGVE